MLCIFHSSQQDAQTNMNDLCWFGINASCMWSLYCLWE